MITYYFKTVKDDTLKECVEPRAGIWAHAVSPTKEECVTLADTFGLDLSILEDATDFFEVPRFERSEGGVYFFTRYPFDDVEEDVDTAPILLVVGESFVVTVVQRRTPFLEPVFNNTITVNTTQKTKLFMQFMSLLTKAYEVELVRMRRVVHRGRIKVRHIRPRDIVQLVKYEHTLNDVIAALVPTNVWLKQAHAGNYLQLYSEDVDLVEDLMIANNQLIDSAQSMLKTIQNVRNASEAILTNTLNATMRLLTALTILLTIPTIVASIYGMNVALPLAEHPYAFWFVLSIIVAAVLTAVYFFTRNRWL